MTRPLPIRRMLAVAVAVVVVGACSGNSTSSSPPAGSSPDGNSVAATTTAGHQQRGSATTSVPTARGAWPDLRRSGDAYVVPDPLAPGSPGDVIAVRDEGPDAPVGGVNRSVVLYHSTAANGADVAVSAALFMPPGPPPAGGWPVVAWAHGTTGIADKCAPSATDNLFYNEYAQLARLWLQHGYAVVATDYVGLGTPGVHSYLVGEDEGNAVIDSVTAAHQLEPGLSPSWFAIGHSQGGQAVLFATRNANARNPDLSLRATVAIAPASGLKLILPAVMGGLSPGDVSYAVYALIGLSTVDPTIRLDSILGPAALAELPAVLNEACLDQTDPAFTRVAPDQILKLSDADTVRLSAQLNRYGDPDTQRTNGPVLVVQGATDQDVPAPVTAAAVRNLQALGSEVTEKVYPDLNHDQVLGPSSCDVLDWLAGHNAPPVGACTAQPSEP